MADIKNIQVDGVDYAVKDETARNSIGDLSQLTTEAKDNLVNAVNELSGRKGPIQRIESLDETNMKNLRDLETGSYVLYGYFRPFAGASNYLPFDNLLVNVYHVDEGSHLFEFSTANSEVNFIEILVDASAEGGHTYSRTAINMLELSGLIAKLGNLDELATTEKGSVVGAINEVAASGGSDSGSSVQPDLAQNDSTQPDYVKNRTHWEDGPNVIEWDGSTEGRDSYTIDNTTTFYCVSNEVIPYDDFANCILVLNDVPNGQTFTDTVTEMGGAVEDMREHNFASCSCVMIAYEDDVSYENIALPKKGVYFARYSDGAYISKLTYGSVTVHPLDEKFIPDTIARVSDIPAGGSGGGVTSWNDLEDRPFDYTKGTSLVEKSVTLAVNDAVGLPLVELTDVLDIIEGNNYVVSFAGEEFICSAKSFQGMLYMGNISLCGQGENTGEPFFLTPVQMLSQAAGCTIIGKEAGTFEFGAYELTVTKKLNAAFLDNLPSEFLTVEIEMSDNGLNVGSASHTCHQMAEAQNNGIPIVAVINSGGNISIANEVVCDSTAAYITLYEASKREEDTYATLDFTTFTVDENKRVSMRMGFITSLPERDQGGNGYFLKLSAFGPEWSAPATAIADLTEAPTAEDFNNLLAALRAAGYLAT